MDPPVRPGVFSRGGPTLINVLPLLLYLLPVVAKLTLIRLLVTSQLHVSDI